ncbi:MAG: hypothetical protein ACE5E8_08795 [Acidimicrobiia bacterium]
MATVDSTHAIAFYNYGGSTDKPKVRLATVSGTTVTWGDEATINSGLAPQGNTGRSITALSSTLAVAAWHDFTPRKGASVAISISGTTLTVGAETRFDDSAFPDAALAFASVQKLTSTTFLVAWRQHTTASGNGRAVVGTVSGTDITYGSPVEFNATQSDRIAVAILSSTKFLVAYEKGTGGQAGRARVGTISGTDITYGAEVEFVASMESAVGWDRMAAVALDSTKAVVFYTNSIGNNRKGQGIVATVSGTDVTFGTASEYHTPAAAGGIVWDASADFIDSTHVVVSYETLTSTGADRRFAVIGTVSGSDITFGPNNVLGFTDNGNGTTSERTFGVLVALSSTSVLGFWPDRSQYNPTVGTVGAPPISSRVGTVSGTDITFGAVTRTGTHAEADGAKAMALDGSRVAMVAQGSVASGDAPNSGALMIGTVSGSSISFDYEANLFHAGDNGEWLSLAVLDGTHVGLAYQTASAATGSRLATIDGTGGGGTVGPADSFPTGARTMWSEKLTSGAFAVYYSSGNGTGPGRVKVMTLEQAANLSASGAYASAIGATRVVAAMWLQKPTFSGATVTVERGYQIAMSGTTITLGGATATWNSAGIGTMMSSLNDGSGHLLVLDFVNTGGTNWTLSTSVDGAAFVGRGTQDLGTQAVTTADTSANVTLVPPGTGNASDQWIDELVFWAGDNSSFDQFTSQELANLFDLADTFGETMNQFEENFGAPLCWQATARMPDGSVWRDSGNGPCPATVRVPFGADDIVVTDDGKKAYPRVIEG